MEKIKVIISFLYFFVGWLSGHIAWRLAAWYSARKDVSCVWKGKIYQNYYPWMAGVVLAGIVVGMNISVLKEIWWAIFLSLQVVAIYFDLIYRIIPFRLSGVLWGIGVIYRYTENQLEIGLLASIVVGCLLLLVYIFSRGMMGGGDPWYAAALSIWTDIEGGLTLLWLSALLGIVVIAILYTQGRYERRMEIPYVPFLSIAAILVTCWQWKWWLG